MDDLRFTICEQLFEVCSDRAVYWPAERTLILSDVHFGKSATFWEFGIPVPDDMESTLSRISTLTETHEVERILVLGDLIHSDVGMTSAVIDAVRSWRDALDIDWEVVPGNHDRHYPEVFDAWRMTRLPATHQEHGMFFVHDPADADSSFTWCGHLHPTWRFGRGPDAVRLPCLAVTDSRIFLPSFTEFSSGSRLRVNARHVWGFLNNQAIYLPVANSAQIW